MFKMTSIAILFLTACSSFQYSQNRVPTCDSSGLPPGMTAKCLPPNPNQNQNEVSDSEAQKPLCTYTYSRPRVIDFEGKKACVALMECRDSEGTTTAICPALSETSCPEAAACRADQTMQQLPGQVMTAFCLDSQGFGIPNCTPAGKIVPWSKN